MESSLDLTRTARSAWAGGGYMKSKNGPTIVTTWLGEEVSRDVQVNGSVITFNRKGMTFRGRLRPDEDCFHFKRTR